MAGTNPQTSNNGLGIFGLIVVVCIIAGMIIYNDKTSGGISGEAVFLGVIVAFCLAIPSVMLLFSGACDIADGDKDCPKWWNKNNTKCNDFMGRKKPFGFGTSECVNPEDGGTPSCGCTLEADDEVEYTDSHGKPYVPAQSGSACFDGGNQLHPKDTDYKREKMRKKNLCTSQGKSTCGTSNLDFMGSNTCQWGTNFKKAATRVTPAPAPDGSAKYWVCPSIPTNIDGKTYTGCIPSAAETEFVTKTACDISCASARRIM